MLQGLINKNATAVVVAGPSAEALAFLARTSGLSAGYTSAYTTLIDGLVTDGVFAKLDTLYVFATADATTAKLNLIQNNYNCTAPNGEPTFTVDAGYTNASNKYLNSGFNASTATSPHYVQDSACMFNWNSNSAQDVGPAEEIGLISGGANRMINRTNADTINVTLNGGNFSVANTDAGGLWTANRTSSSNVDIYQNAASFALSNSSTSAAVQNADMTFFVGSNFNTTAILKVGGWGVQLNATDVANLHGRLTTFFATIP